MKSNFLKAAIALLGAGCILATSCLQNQETVKPVFPENKIQKTVVAGESVDIVFEANLDWELSLSGDGVMSYFWIDDAGTKESKIKGSAGSQTVTVKFSEENELDTNRKCIVTLTMGGESCEIAEIDRLMIARTVVIKVAEHWETAFMKVDGNYVYADIEEGASLKFISFPEEPDYALPIKVQSNFDWELALPEWIETSVSGGKAGDTEVYLTAVVSESIKNGETGKINFVDASNQEAKIEVEISIDSFADRVDFEGKDFDFNAAGQIKSAMGEYMDGSGYFTVLAAKGAVVRVLGFDGNYHDTDFATWVTVEETESEGEAFLSKRSFSIKAKANDGDARVADILVLPASMAELGPEQLCVSADGCPFTEAVQPYVFGRIEQSGKEVQPVTEVLSVNPDYDAYEYIFKYNPNIYIKPDFKTTDQLYSLTYTHEEWSEVQILSSVQIAGAMILDYNFNVVEDTDNFWAECWISPDKNAFKVNYDLSIYNRVGAEDEETVPECYIVLGDASGNYIAIIDFKVDLNATEEPGGVVLSILDGDAEITKITSSDDRYNWMHSEYYTDELYEVVTSSKKTIFANVANLANYSILSITDNGAVDCVDNSLTLEGVSEGFYLSVAQSVSETRSWIVVLQDENMVPMVAIYYTYIPGETEELISIVQSYDATLSKYSGELLDQLLETGVSEDYIYELRYSGDDPYACLSVPGEPYYQCAWNNEDGSDNYWLTYELAGPKMMYVNMSEVGMVDWFVWKDGNGPTANTVAILVCTRTE